jgi:GT2 family glycosyltransferase
VTAAIASAAPSRVCVIVLAFNARADVLACLASLQAEVGVEDAVLVVDNGSHDSTAAAVRHAHPWCEVIENHANLGYAAGNNVGIRQALARGFRWVWILNQDTVVEPGALATLLRAGEASAQPCVLQPLLIQCDDPARVDAAGLAPRHRLGGGVVGHGTPVAAVPDGPCAVFGACGAAIFAHTQVLRTAGLLDDELFLLCEDFDLMFRARMAGAEVLLHPQARVRHRGGISTRQRTLRAALVRKQLLQRNTVALALAYWPTRSLLASAPLLLWRAAVALVLAALPAGHGCLRLWRRYWRARRDARAAMRAHDLDRWFVEP